MPDPDDTVIQVSGVPLGERVTVEQLEYVHRLGEQLGIETEGGAK